MSDCKREVHCRRRVCCMAAGVHHDSISDISEPVRSSRGARLDPWCDALGISHVGQFHPCYPAQGLWDMSFASNLTSDSAGQRATSGCEVHPIGFEMFGSAGWVCRHLEKIWVVHMEME